MMLKDLLEEKQSAIIRRWLADTFATYSSGASEFFQHTQNPFTNPVGNALRKGITGIFECLLAEKPDESIRVYLNDVIKIRAVQEFSPSQALSFIFLLKNAIRAEIGVAVDNPELTMDLAKFESKIDRVALLAFEVYMNCREQVFTLRVNEVKRSVSAIMTRFNRNGIKPDLASEPARDKTE
jgi:hypothetical protein